MLNKLKHLITIYNFCIGITVFMLAGLNLAHAERNYTYVLTVKMDANDPNYDPNTNYNTINSAIVAMNTKSPPLAADRLGVIRVYNGIYVEQLNSSQDGNDLPAHCDLIGMGMQIADVEIYHTSPSGSYIYVPGVNCISDNVVSHLKIYNPSGNNSQVGIYFRGDGTLDNCIVSGVHGPAVEGYGHLIVKGAGTEISTYYRSCIRADSTFEIYDCNLKPKTFSLVGQGPGGIDARGSGIIDGVTISCPYGLTKEEYTILTGIVISISDDEYVKILNTNINLHLTSKYYPTQPPPVMEMSMLIQSIMMVPIPPPHILPVTIATISFPLWPPTITTSRHITLIMATRGLI